MLVVDRARAQAEAVWDGYQMARTSETNLTDQQILGRYRQLWRIEQTFRVSKTGLKTRPVYVRTPEHIEAHFAICFLALLVERLLERWTGLPSPQLLDALRDFQAVPVGEGRYRICRPAIWDTVDAATGTPFDHSWADIEQLRQWRRDLTKTARFTTHPKPAQNHPNPQATPQTQPPRGGNSGVTARRTRGRSPSPAGATRQRRLSVPGESRDRPRARRMTVSGHIPWRSLGVSCSSSRDHCPLLASK